MKKLLLALVFILISSQMSSNKYDLAETEETLAKIEVVQRDGEIYFRTTYVTAYFSNRCEVFMYVVDNPMSFCTEIELEDILLNSIEIDSI